MNHGTEKVAMKMFCSVLFRAHEHGSFIDIYGEIDINKIIIIPHGSLGRSGKVTFSWAVLLL